MSPNRTLTLNKKILIASTVFLILSITDGLLTLWGLKLKVIEEANPIMQLLIDKSTIGFIVYKLSLPVILGAFCWRVKDKARKLVVFTLGFVISVYSLLMMLHVYWIIVT